MEKEKFKNRPFQVITRRKDGSIDVGTVPTGDDMAQQQFKDQSDVNHIMKKYRGLGYSYDQLPEPSGGSYIDLVELPSYEESLKIVIQAEQTFMSLPAELRDRFQNDPNKLIKFLADKNNNDEAIKLGLVNPKKDKVPTTDEILTDISQTLKSQNSKKTTKSNSDE